MELWAFEWMPPITLRAKMDFSLQILEQKWWVFLYNTQCIDASDNVHTCLEGEGITGAVGVLEGVAMVMDGDEKHHT
jgi:hypothetical protein